MTTASPPLNVTQLEDRLAQVAGAMGLPVARARVMLCTLVVSQMLPDGVAVKGGMASCVATPTRPTASPSPRPCGPSGSTTRG
ncbi:hypothetical protein GCM10025875_32010 [Litorihabitans aurantiacus]|uniref:Uncharacterized protein n=1 Tax=Litorihabitans aurantiacus TaxID=1930061 RepID=A0AA37XHG4_9MICO|nr:hypothetical protein GCM10025875_32010 [Litorihabitans aurantiacus]